MAQTSEGAIKVAAQRAGITADEYRSRIASGLKRCTKCKNWRAVGEFARDASRHDGRSAKCTWCTRVAVRKCTKGRPSTFKGRSHTLEARALMSASRKGRPGPWKGKTLPPDVREKISRITRERTARGPDHYAYTHGKHQRDKCDRRTVEYRKWRDEVFARDRFACQQCGDARGGNLQAHHIKPFASHPELRFSVSNGLTLCRDCHERLHLKPIPGHKCRRRKHPLPSALAK
jgi:5-methylcytosine-specific restriction endonuclease McrA